MPLVVLLLGLTPLLGSGRAGGTAASGREPLGAPSAREGASDADGTSTTGDGAIGDRATGDRATGGKGASRSGRPGDLVRYIPVDGAPAGIRAWRVVYRSRTFGASTVQVSGLVLAPRTPSATTVPTGGRRVVSFAHGTTGVADSCAPSAAKPPLAAAAWMFSLVRAGHVVTLTDYAGLGTPGEHAIYVAGPEGRAVLDIARAVRAIKPAGAGRDVVLWGYSQGGQAVLSAGAQAASYAPDLRIHGVVASAPLADLPRSLAGLEQRSDGVGYLILAMIGASDADPRIDLTRYLKPKGRHLLTVARTRCAPDLLTASTGVNVRAAFTQDPLRQPQFAAAFARQRDEVTRRMTPTLILQGDRDTVIRRQDTDSAVRRLCSAGTTVDYRRYPQADHGTILSASMSDLTTWITRRFASHPQPVTNICAVQPAPTDPR
ncbi:lipase family protein [Frankia sp. AiPa1]|uniref:lipase family protein n=1 Tax=Frankia sp. AiPa1 TaxID=573492 RepID=UPI00202B242D|nr:lipase family protein [Frankia sp. AiPa1]MCL9760731.1 lipase family protein [Frankia sp. AiPa1]